MKTLIFSYKFLLMTLISLPLALCSSDNTNDDDMVIVDPDPDNNGNGNPDGNGNTDNDKLPEEGDPTDIVLVNIGLGRLGYQAPFITGGLEGPLRLRTDIGPIEQYSDKVNDNDVVIFFGANSNNDGSFPDKSIDMPKPYSLSELRNNQVISFIITDKDDPETNIKITVDQPFSFTTTGIHIQGQRTRQIASGEATFTRLKDNALGHETVKFTVGELDIRDYGKLIISESARSIVDTGNFIELFGKNGNEIYGRTIQVAIDQDNAKPGLGGDDQRILIQP